jgi:hypothetical protein
MSDETTLDFSDEHEDRRSKIAIAHAVFGDSETDDGRLPLPEHISISAVVEHFAAWLRSYGGPVPSEGIGVPIDDLLLIHIASVRYLSDDPCDDDTPSPSAQSSKMSFSKG